MSKTIYTILVIGVSMLFMTPTYGQLAKWDLTDDANPNFVSTNLQASSFERGNGIGGLNFSTDGAVARGWPTVPQKGVVDFYEICLTPNAGFTFELTGLKFQEQRTAEGIQAYQVFWSTDGFKTSERLDSVAASVEDVTRSIHIENLNETFCDGQPLCIRWYGYHATTDNGQWFLKNLEVEGNVVPFCMPPAVQTRSIEFSNIQDGSIDVTLESGDGDRRLVLVREGSEVDASLCSGNIYTTNSTFGLGDEVAPGTFAVYDGSSLDFSIDGLTSGAFYHFFIIEYNSLNFCYLNDDPLTAVVSANCSTPVLPQNLMINPGDGVLNLMWEAPSCYDEVLLLASTAPIDGFPMGEGEVYQADAVFGQGDIVNGSFIGDVYPVYKGIDDRVTISNLANNDLYYFELFARKGDDWVGPIAVQDKPLEGCEDLGFDMVFINEIHYLNNGTDQDEGVEIAGPAGLDLSAYSLVLYQYNPSIAYHIEKLSGVIDDEVDGNGAVWFPIPDMWDSRGAIALYNNVTQEVVQFLGFRGTLTAEDGVAEGMESVLLRNSLNMGVAESNATPLDASIQLEGTGSCPSDMTWEVSLQSSRGSLNSQQSILPVELLDFKATLIDEQVLLSWTTVSEIDNAYMAVERSNDGSKYQEIGRVEGAGTTNLQQYYQLLDPSPERGANYYRLRQVDFDGTINYSPVVVIQIDIEGVGFKVFPTLTADWFTVATNNIADSGAVVTIFNELGQKIEQYQISDSDQSLLLNSAAWAPGLYFIQLEVGTDSFTERLIKR